MTEKSEKWSYKYVCLCILYVYFKNICIKWERNIKNIHYFLNKNFIFITEICEYNLNNQMKKWGLTPRKPS